MRARTMTMAALLSTSIGCVEEHPDGELTGDLCFAGYVDETWIPMVTHGTMTLDVGRLRQRTHSTIEPGDEAYTVHRGALSCDAEEPVTVESADVVTFDGDDVTARVQDGRLVVESAGPAQADVFVNTSHGRITLSVRAQDVDRTSLTYHGAHAARGETLRVSAGSTLVFEEVAYTHDGSTLSGHYDWTTNTPWSLSRAVVHYPDASRRVTEAWERQVAVRVDDRAGTHPSSIPHLAHDDHDIVVVPAHEIAQIVVCETSLGACIEEGDELEAHSALSDTGEELERASFRVIVRDIDGHEVLGRPDDFELVLPEGWRDARPAEDVLGGMEWRIERTSGPTDDARLEVRAFGRSASFGLVSH